MRSALNISDNEISLIQQSHPYDVKEQIFQVLKLWREKNKGTATLAALLEKCESYPDLDIMSSKCVQKEIDRLGEGK